MSEKVKNPIYVAGIDVGSMAAKAVIYDVTSDKVFSRAVVPTGWAPKEFAYHALECACANNQAKTLRVENISYIMATGYGRVSIPFADSMKTEISCHAKAVSTFYPNAGLVLDIGGQDSKVISLDKEGNILDFMMNDKCAAGTGRFLHVVAGILDISLEELGKMASRGKILNISNMCAVFAESEIIGLLAQGAKPEDVAAGVFASIARRMRALAKRVSWNGQCVFTGGLATNPQFAKHLADELNLEVVVPENPQCMGALGASLYAKQAYIKHAKNK